MIITYRRWSFGKKPVMYMTVQRVDVKVPWDALASEKNCWIGNIEVTKVSVGAEFAHVAVSVEEAAKEGKF